MGAGLSVLKVAALSSLACVTGMPVLVHGAPLTFAHENRVYRFFWKLCRDAPGGQRCATTFCTAARRFERVLAQKWRLLVGARAPVARCWPPTTVRKQHDRRAVAAMRAARDAKIVLFNAAVAQPSTELAAVRARRSRRCRGRLRKFGGLTLS